LDQVSAVIRTLVFIVATALFANAQCYGECTSDCHPAETKAPDGCRHHHQSPPPTGGICQHQHVTVNGPEGGAGLFKLHASGETPLMAVLTSEETLFGCDLFIAPTRIQDTSPPKGEISPGSTILRI
jgi:hypothetical protein